LVSFIYTVVNCSAWSVVAATYTTLASVWRDRIVYGNVWSAASSWSVVSGHGWVEWDYERL